MVYSPSERREDIVESMRARRAYAATDNILLDYHAFDSRGRAHMMGEAFESAAAPKIVVKIIGTAPISQFALIKNGRFVYEGQPGRPDMDFTFVDNAFIEDESWYYIRVVQSDRNVAWSSPIWVRRRR
jgi:hypothetical protein